MAPLIENFESLAFNPYHTNHCFLNNKYDPDNNIYNVYNSFDFLSEYTNAEELSKALYLRSNNRINFLNANIRSLRRNIPGLKQLLIETENVFDIICLSKHGA